MPIAVNLDVMLAKRKMTLSELSEEIGITMANLSILKLGKARAIRFTTLDKICRALECEAGDIIEYMDEEKYMKLYGRRRNRDKGDEDLDDDD